MEYGMWFVVIFALIYEPIFGYREFQKFKVEVKTNENARVKFYKNSIIGLWVPTIFIFLLIGFTELTVQDIGLSMPSLNTQTLGPWVTYIVFAIALLYTIGILYYSIGYHYSYKISEKMRQVRQKESDSTSFLEILPVTKREKEVWNYVSLTAGITEEIIYRGFLMFALSFLFPDLSIWVVILLSSILFGLAHTYQGLVTGVIRTTIFGIVFSILYIGLGSIVPLIILHFLIDYLAKLGD
ncbi:CPBP family intramembrane metalloprotease [Sutcliffiella horikoshii]|uniref:CPBP family intramembrane glutamic endopeptidase n=1 Tax=Sutcliffiella horikoshii TaxID=79883 RepID=UPI00203BCE5C|nr:CPBP family intramembrane glutamic endopeptidase [Sutcliffiella horikoshii]MCM3618322.1 CPBP family intramembrane metalloprotease [Sutcliffiella horikoshii]